MAYAPPQRFQVFHAWSAWPEANATMNRPNTGEDPSQRQAFALRAK
jgi:hypothetical protein